MVALVVSMAGFATRSTGSTVAAAPASAWPSTLEVLSHPAGVIEVPPGLVSRNTGQRVQASRSGLRDQLAECSGATTGNGKNGRLPASELCDLWQRPYQDRADAVVTLTALNEAFRARFGTDMCLSSGYRDLEEQAALRASKGSLAAPAGQSNHGWGLAVDFCASTYTGEPGRWLAENGQIYGWANPRWAKRGGGGPFEPWHWEFTSGVAQLAGGVNGR